MLNFALCLLFLQYIRVDAKTDVNILEQFILKHWKLKKPNLIISVTGGAQNFTLRSRLSKVFRKSLIKLSESTGGQRMVVLIFPYFTY